jgi:hypothetical protein
MSPELPSHPAMMRAKTSRKNQSLPRKTTAKDRQLTAPYLLARNSLAQPSPVPEPTAQRKRPQRGTSTEAADSGWEPEEEAQCVPVVPAQTVEAETCLQLPAHDEASGTFFWQDG